MPRRSITDAMSLDDAYFYLAYTADALAACGAEGDKEVGALVAPLEKLLARNDELTMERRARRRAIGRSHALVRRRDVQADAVVTDAHNDTLASVKLDRTEPLFKRLFPDPLSTVVRKALESQLPDMRELHLKLAEPETPAELRKKHDKPLSQAIEHGQAALHAREEAFAANGRTSARVASWREDANHALLGIEGALKSIAAARRLKTDWVDAFFAAPDRAVKSATEEAPPATPSGT